MAYIGQQPFQEFSSVPTKDSFTGDGSTTTFDLANDVVRGGENALEVFVDNVRQEPGSGKAYTLGVDGSGNLRRITFTAAPANGAGIYVINDKTNLSAIAPVNTDFNGVELVLDADADTTIHAETDDIIDIRVADNDIIKIQQSSGDGILKVATDAKDLIFQQADGNKLFEINDGNFVGVGGNATAPGEIRIFEDSDNGSNYSGFKAAASTTSSVAYQLPAADGSSGTHLTTDGSGVLSWTASLSLANDSNNRVVTGTGSGLNGEANLTFDGSTLDVTGAVTVSGAITGSSTVQGTTITATTAFVPDASDGAALGTSSLEFSDLFLADGAVINLGDDQDVTLTHVADTGVLLNGASVIQFRDSGLTIGSNADGDLDIVSDGTNVDSINIESAGGITLDAGTAGSGIVYEDDGTEMMRIHNSSSDVILESKVSDKDIIFKVNDGGSSTEVARFDGDVSALLMASGKEIRFADSGEKISGNGTDLTLNSGADINLTATTDINVPANVGITFGDDAEKIEGDGTDLTISANNLTVDAAADIILDAAGNDFQFKADGTHVFSIVNSSSDVVLKPIVDAKDLIFQQRDGTEVARIEDNGTFNVVTDKLAINGTAVTATAAELNLLDGGTSVGSSITLVDADGVVVNDGGTMKTIPASDVKTYASGSSATKGFAIAAAIVFG